VSVRGNFDKQVSESEAVIENQNASWTQEMRKRVAETRAYAEQCEAAGRPNQ